MTDNDIKLVEDRDFGEPDERGQKLDGYICLEAVVVYSYYESKAAEAGKRALSFKDFRAALARGHMGYAAAFTIEPKHNRVVDVFCTYREPINMGHLEEVLGLDYGAKHLMNAIDIIVDEQDHDDIIPSSERDGGAQPRCSTLKEPN